MATVTTGGVQTYDLIATFSNTAGTFTFSSIPQTYEHLVLHVSLSASAAPSSFYITLNSDTANNYSYAYLSASNFMGFSYNWVGQPTINNIQVTSLANLSGNGSFLYIPGYASTTLKKGLYVIGGCSTSMQRLGGLYSSTSAITSISGGPSNSTANTIIKLFGLKKV